MPVVLLATATLETNSTGPYARAGFFYSWILAPYWET